MITYSVKLPNGGTYSVIKPGESGMEFPDDPDESIHPWDSRRTKKQRRERAKHGSRRRKREETECQKAARR